MVQYDDRFHSRVIQGEFTDEYTFVMDGIVVVVGVVVLGVVVIIIIYDHINTSCQQCNE